MWVERVKFCVRILGRKRVERGNVVLTSTPAGSPGG
jgi:hypothetical protein